MVRVDYADALHLIRPTGVQHQVAAHALQRGVGQGHVNQLHVAAGGVAFKSQGMPLWQADGHSANGKPDARAGNHPPDVLEHVREAVPLHALAVKVHVDVPVAAALRAFHHQHVAFPTHLQVRQILPVIADMNPVVKGGFHRHIVGNQVYPDHADAFRIEGLVNLGILVLILVVIIIQLVLVEVIFLRLLAGILADNLLHALEAVHHRGDGLVLA